MSLELSLIRVKPPVSNGGATQITTNPLIKNVRLAGNKPQGIFFIEMFSPDSEVAAAVPW
jgi:hypothetical protein